ncbi:rhodanese-like domain-containing protein [Streptomyces iconiensis]|uniref:Rhodanese-like domain-containing protein n=1 Tax=Streptomyces iconiensis TaxID=1384038 RepID=A0ABT6ZZ73_9ACTN|nr:rhodanese-like domain-containing protein [Streptomyces iconiensis]MDJ1134354.1 rhodanese-like domain-containing protein [Streptomyces iconiensis]
MTQSTTGRPAQLTVPELEARRPEFTVIDVRTPGEYASGHIPGAHNVPLDRLGEAVSALRVAAQQAQLALVCASGNRSDSACRTLADAGVTASSVRGGTTAWTQQGHPADRAEGAGDRWPMERQVRLAAGSLVLAGLAAGLARPRARLLSAAIGAGLVFSAVTGTCGMATVLGKLPYNRSGAGDLDAVLERLAG